MLSLFSQDTFKIDIPKGAENMRKLDVWIKGKNMKDIARYLRSPVLLRKHLQRECFGDDVNCFLSMHSMQFLKDLGIQESNLSTPEKAACNALWNGSQTFKQNSAGITETHHIRQYLGIINRSPKSRTEKLKVQRNVIREFFPTIQPRLLVELGILSENEAKEKIKDGLEEIFGERYFIDGTPEEKYEKQQFLE